MTNAPEGLRHSVVVVEPNLLAQGSQTQSACPTGHVHTQVPPPVPVPLAEPVPFLPLHRFDRVANRPPVRPLLQAPKSLLLYTLTLQQPPHPLHPRLAAEQQTSYGLPQRRLRQRLAQHRFHVGAVRRALGLHPPSLLPRQHPLHLHPFGHGLPTRIKRGSSP